MYYVSLSSDPVWTTVSVFDAYSDMLVAKFLTKRPVQSIKYKQQQNLQRAETRTQFGQKQKQLNRFAKTH